MTIRASSSSACTLTHSHPLSLPLLGVCLDLKVFFVFACHFHCETISFFPRLVVLLMVVALGLLLHFSQSYFVGMLLAAAAAAATKKLILAIFIWLLK